MRLLMLCVLAALVAAPVYGASEVKEGGKFLQGAVGAPLMLNNAADSLGYGLRNGSVTGSALVDDADRDRDNVQYWPDVIDRSFMEGLVYADSSQVYNVTGYRQMWVTIYVYPDSGDAASTATGLYRFALMTRYHAGGAVDSLSTFAIPARANSFEATGGTDESYGESAALSATTAASYETEIDYYYSVSQATGRGYRVGGFAVPITVGSNGRIPAWVTHVDFKLRMLIAPGTSVIRARAKLGLLVAS